jgi:hypothetical protein
MSLYTSLFLMVDGPNRHVTFDLFKGLFNLSQKKILLPNYSKNHDVKKKLHQWHFILEELSRQADEMRRVPIHVGTLTAIAVSRLGDAGRAPVAPPTARQILGPARTTGGIAAIGYTTNQYGLFSGPLRFSWLAAISLSVDLAFLALSKLLSWVTFSSFTAFSAPGHVTFFSLHVTCSPVRLSSLPDFPVAFSFQFVCFPQLPSQSLILCSEFLNFSVHVLGVRPKLVNLHLHPFDMEDENFLQFHAQPFHMSDEDVSQLSVQLLVRGWSPARPFIPRRIRVPFALTASANPSLTLAPLVHALTLSGPPHLPANLSPSFTFAPFFCPLRPTADLPANLDSLATFRSPVTFGSPTFGLDALDPHFSVFAHIGNLEPVPFLQRSSRPPEFLTLGGDEHGHMVVPLERLDDDPHMPAFTDLALCKADKNAAQFPVSVALLSRENAAECQYHKHNEHQCSMRFFHDSSPF